MGIGVKQTAVIVAPGRGTYNKTELGYLSRLHSDKAELLGQIDAYRRAQGQEPVTELDEAPRFSSAKLTRGDNASPLIYACAYADFLSIDREAIDIVAVTGNSMGWYIALACAGALDAMGGLQLVNTMGTLMQESLIGGQLVYPVFDDDWIEVPGRGQTIVQAMAEINQMPDHDLALSIDLGGMLVLAGNEAGLSAFEKQMPPIDGRFPMRLKNHAAFHTELQQPVAEAGRANIDVSLFRQPELPLIDGRGSIWQPKATNLAALYDYTLNHQVVEPYEFAIAIRTAAREFMPDLFIVLGPGTTLGGSVAQSMIKARWRGVRDKNTFKTVQDENPRLISMGMDEQRRQVTSP